MRKIVISGEFDPYFNIAAEYELFLDSDEDTHLFLWQNDASVIIGRNQNLYAECDLAYMKEHNIHAVRRLSGGGAVYHDRGNLNFTFLTKEKTANPIKFIEMIRTAIEKLGIICETGGRNDLLYGSRKFSGHAYYTDSDNYLYHGTILVSADIGQLEKALTPSMLKLKSKGITSVKNRVINLSSIYSDITIEGVKQALIETFACKNIEYVNKVNFRAPLQRMLSSYDWLYAQSPEFETELERSYSFGNISVSVRTFDGVMQGVKIYTDSLCLFNFKPCEDELTGKSFSEHTVWECIEQYIFS